MRLKAGERIRLASTSDPYTRLRPGDEGTVLHTGHLDTSHGVIHVHWDSGSSLSLIEGEDQWEPA